MTACATELPARSCCVTVNVYWPAALKVAVVVEPEVEVDVEKVGDAAPLGFVVATQETCVVSLMALWNWSWNWLTVN